VAFASSLDQIGCIARTVSDAAALLEIIAGADERDATAGPPPGWSVSGLSAGGAGDQPAPRVAVPTQAWQGLDAGCRASFSGALGALEELGCSVSEVDLEGFGLAVPAYAVLSCAEAATNLARFDGLRFGRRAEASSLHEMICASRDQGFGVEVKRRILLGTFVLAAGFRESFYGRAQAARARLVRVLTRVLRDNEVIATPTSPGPAFPLGSRVDDPLAMYHSDVFTVAANLAGLPAISVPMSPSGASSQCSACLPLGLHLMAAAWQEQLLIRLAARFEEARGEPPLPPMPAVVRARNRAEPAS
jgi:aspartyl-tRNA(Asn)/glutamyl-tRNA(Gln) amidotransferase subunit A